MTPQWQKHRPNFPKLASNFKTPKKRAEISMPSYETPNNNLSAKHTNTTWLVRKHSNSDRETKRWTKQNTLRKSPSLSN
jgi:hypothetical protein